MSAHGGPLVHGDGAFRVRRSAARCAVWPGGIVMAAPLLDQDPGFAQAAEDFTTEQFVAESRIETFAISVLPWVARLGASRFAPTAAIQSRTFRAMNSGPWSGRICSGGPRRMKRSVKASGTSAELRLRSGRRARGLRPFRDGLHAFRSFCKNHLVRGQVRYCPTQPLVLLLKLLEPLELRAPHPAVKRASVVIRLLRLANLTRRRRNCHALSLQNYNPPKLGYDFFRPFPLSSHRRSSDSQDKSIPAGGPLSGVGGGFSR